MRELIIKIVLILALAACILLCMTDIGQSTEVEREPEARASVSDEASGRLYDSEAGLQGSMERPLGTEEKGTDVTESKEAETVPIAKKAQAKTYAPSPLPVPDCRPAPAEIERAYVLRTIKIQPGRELFEEFFPKEDYDKTVDILAKVLWGESRGVFDRSKTNCACVVWCVLNRVDEGMFGDTPRECATAGSQFRYRKSFPVKAYFKELAEDVLTRWLLEKSGEEDVGRVLPEGYCYFSGNGKYNMFRKKCSGENQKRLTPKTSEVYEG